MLESYTFNLKDFLIFHPITDTSYFSVLSTDNKPTQNCQKFRNRNCETPVSPRIFGRIISDRVINTHVLLNEIMADVFPSDKA